MHPHFFTRVLDILQGIILCFSLLIPWTGVLLGHDLTTSSKIANQYNHNLKNFSLDQILQYVRLFIFDSDNHWYMFKATLAKTGTKIPSVNEYGKSLNIPIKRDYLRYSANGMC